MATVDVSFRIGGEAGQGVESSGAGFAQALSHAGFWAFGVPDYYSRIRGGHNFFTIRVSDEPVYSFKNTVEILLALNQETVERHVNALAPGAIVVADQSMHLDESLLQGRDAHLVRPPTLEIAEKHGSKVMKNTADLAVAAALVDFDIEAMIRVIEKNFGKKGGKIVEANRQVAQEAYSWTKEHAGGATRWTLQNPKPKVRVSLSGNQAFSIGALAGGCKFVAGYPMTPSTSVLEYMAGHADNWGLVVKHAEDEIAAINMAVGAGHAGVRALVPTSGGGFDLMTEGVSLAGMMETPVVILLGQRPGPATGMATRTEQADLFLALNAGHSEFPRVVLAPHTPLEAFQCAIRAFNIAETYQLTVIVLSDEYLAGSVWTYNPEAFDFESVTIDRGKLLTAADLEKMDGYNRFAITPDGVSPRALPGSSPKAAYFITSDEHLENGHITEDAQVRSAMVSKRMRKLDAARAAIRPPFTFGPQDADLTFVSWGSSFGPVHEAMQRLNAQGTSANMVHFVDLHPFPVEGAQQALRGATRIVDVEQNAMAQFAFLLHAHTGITVDHKVLKFDGRGFTPEYILAHLEGK